MKQILSRGNNIKLTYDSATSQSSSKGIKPLDEAELSGGNNIKITYDFATS